MSDHGIISLLWQDNTVAGRVILLFLMVLGATAGSAAMRHRGRYRHRETRTLNQVRSRLQELRDADQPTERSEDGERPPLPPPWIFTCCANMCPATR